MFPMAMPPHFGGGLPPLAHSTIYSPHISNNNTVHASKPFPAPSGNQHVYSPNQIPMYISPYNSTITTASIPHTQPPPVHSQASMVPTLHSNNFRESHPTHSFRHQRYRELSNAATASNRELFEKIDALHLGYIETEDSPQKMEQRHKMEEVIHEYLGITPHSFKFSSPHVKEILENSINRKSDFDPHKAGCAFDALAQFAANLIVHPWRKEFRELKLYSGFWVHNVGSHLVGAESILEQMGFVGTRQKGLSSHTWPGSHFSSTYVHNGVVDPDLICGLALDCMIAYCECQVLKRIREGVAEFGMNIQQILQFRQVYIGDIEVSRRHLQLTARQKLLAATQSANTTENLLNLSSSPPPIPSRQNSSFSATTSMNQFSKRMPASSPPDPYHSQQNNMASSSSKAKTLKPKGESVVDSKRKPNTLNLRQASESSSSHSRNKSSNNDSYSAMLRSTMNSCQVPTAKLIDLDTSHDTSYRTSSKHHLPKTIAHKSSKSHHSSREILHEPDIAPSDPISPEVFKPRTLDEHLEASLNIAKNSSKSRSKVDPKSSLETWDFVYKNLERKGYVKDIGDRGDILNDLTKQNDVVQRNKTSKNRPLTVTDSKPENRPVEKSKRLSTYDNVQEAEGRSKESVNRWGEKQNTWSCNACTYLNPENLCICEMCGKSRTVTNDALQSGGKQCANCTLINDREAISCSVCSHTLTGCSTYI